ncbi:MAG TPA: hypothetical protein VFI36_03735 [Arthrobacter sp.]|nr:hypothetical protein [Arthrobacter sp.]
MPNSTTQPDNTDATAPDTSGSGTAGTKDPTGVEGTNPALDDTGHVKAAEVGEAAEPPENPEDLDVTPEDS